ncbi:hypothetical protein [Vibrio rotiferianus]|uniref:hypothetical protein n=1 Tax=Vibrio rotiferianus TaxID=190895 RepID=UPI00148D495A|nr:hypothetical protein [Vibrio rotiferianus]NOH68766.1 hypothetical protein [Vibrio rotiferianus]
MLASHLTLVKNLGVVAAFTAIAYLSYDYGVTTTLAKAQQEQNALFDKYEQKQDEAFTLAVILAKQQPDIRIQYRTIEKKVIEYAQENTNKQCIANDADWLHIRAESVRAHNRAIGIQQPATVTDGTTATTPYQRDAEVLAEDVANIQTCAENAQRLRALQLWIEAQLQ